MADHVGDDFAVGRRAEDVTERLQPGLQLGVIFNDSVVDDDHLAVAAHMRVRVDVGCFAVSRPASVADSSRAVDRVGFDEPAQFVDSALTFPDADFTIVLNGNSGAVVTTIFKPPQAFQQKIRG